MRRYSAREQTSLPRSMQMFFSNCCCLWRQLLCANVYKESSVQKFPWCCARALLHVSIIISSMLCLTIPRSVLSLDIKPWEAGIFFYVCALDGLFWDRQFVLLFRISKIEKSLDKFKCWKATSFFVGASSPAPWGGSCPSLGIWLWRVLVSCQEYFGFPRMCCWCSPSPRGGAICRSLMAAKQEQLFHTILGRRHPASFSFLLVPSL